MKTIAEQIKWDFEANDSLEIKDKKGGLIYNEFSNEYWTKREYDSKGNEIYFEDSGGDVEDDRPKPSEDKVVEIDGVKYKLTKL